MEQVQNDWGMAGVKAREAEGKQGHFLPSLSESSFRTAEWKLALRITLTPPFQRSAFLTNFLLYICDRKLSNRETEITEYQIGVQALGRPAAYHPGEDNIVRNYARMLRRQLDEYFTHDGRDEPLRIVIPRGRYIPLFEAHTPAETPGSPRLEAEPEADAPQARLEQEPLSELPSPTVADGADSIRPSVSLRFATVALLFAAVLAAGWVYSHLRTRERRGDLYTAFWQELVAPGRVTYIVTGDSGFALLQDLTRREISLSEYVNGDFDKWFPEYDATNQHDGQRFDADRLSGYTSVADLNTVVALMRLPEISRADVVVRNARDIQIGEVRRSNLVLLGGPLANPWTDLFEASSDFRVEFSPQHDERSIVNLHPRPGEQVIFRNGGETDPQNTYAILLFLPNLDGNGHALLIEGLSIAGTQAGADFVSNERMMMPILQQARLSDGSIGRFEIVLQTRSIGPSAANAHPVVMHCGAAG